MLEGGKTGGKERIEGRKKDRDKDNEEMLKTGDRKEGRK
jgi:hypothetical protein